MDILVWMFVIKKLIRRD